MPQFILMVVHSNGESEVIALWLVAYENKPLINSLTETFVHYNDTTNTCIMADKDMPERELLAEINPNSSVVGIPVSCASHI